ncbi:hypothetical protein SADUNF_Sadunf16G0294700 [Salix dunnii]|uniref:Uncharacterized protein n=1 Tax=Salix dunnii TaxID=1413687 RepID=A0A835MN48_9ROSI|nr:hypothetical protein SADUNF_Sadunf16G0294700 [Salix dunnii]
MFGGGSGFDLDEINVNVGIYLHRIEHFEGNMLSIPKGEAIIMKWVTQCCDDEHLLKLMRNDMKLYWTKENKPVPPLVLKAAMEIVELLNFLELLVIANVNNILYSLQQ